MSQKEATKRIIIDYTRINIYYVFIKIFYECLLNKTTHISSKNEQPSAKLHDTI